jgi:hypothetical protein
VTPIRISPPTAPADETADSRVVPLFEGEWPADPALQALADLGEAKPGLRTFAVAHPPGAGRLTLAD